MPSHASALPARRSRLIGRQEELLAVRDRLLHGDSRLLTLSGAAGAGKTTLALEVARLVEEEMPDGVALIDLMAVRERDTIAMSLCEALGLVAQGPSPATVLGEYLATRQTVIVLDNCEHLLPALGSVVDRLLDRCPDVRFLATSRSALRVHGESVFVVPPLPIPTFDGPRDLDRFSRSPAVELFVERARAASPTFRLTEAWAPAVRSICRRLDGLPLAIELVAAQAAALTPPEIEERLTSATTIGGPRAGREGRQHTMDATLAWSYELLDDAERFLFRRLGVFAGGWTLTAAERICSLGGDASTIMPTLVSLVGQSLVLRDEGPDGSHFRMLAPLAEFAARLLADSEDLGPVSIAHAQYYLALASQGSPQWQRNDPEQLDLIAGEHENCLAALRFAEEARLVPIVLGFDIAMLGFWGIRGHMRTGQRRLEAALALVGDEPSRGRAFLFGALAAYGQLIGDLTHAAERAAEAEAMFVALDDLIGTRTAIGIRGDIAAELGDLEQARAHYDRAWPLVEAAPDDAVLGYWHGNVGMIALRGGDLVGARRELEQARDHFGRAPAWYLGRVLDKLGSLARLEGRADEAAPLLAEAVEILRRYGAVNEAIHCFEELGRVAIDRHDPRRAAVLFGAATGFRESTARTISPADRKALVRDLDRTRSELPRSSFADAWSRGLAMSFDEAVGFARSTARGMAHGPQGQRGSILTPREHEIAQLVGLAMTNRQIADQLVVSTGTVRIHVERILGKLGLTSRVQIATWVVGEHQADAPVTQAS